MRHRIWKKKKKMLRNQKPAAAVLAPKRQFLKIPIFAMVDTNSDPRQVDYVIPANDDASKSSGAAPPVAATDQAAFKNSSEVSIKSSALA